MPGSSGPSGCRGSGSWKGGQAQGSLSAMARRGAPCQRPGGAFTGMEATAARRLSSGQPPSISSKGSPAQTFRLGLWSPGRYSPRGEGHGAGEEKPTVAAPTWPHTVELGVDPGVSCGVEDQALGAHRRPAQVLGSRDLGREEGSLGASAGRPVLELRWDAGPGPHLQRRCPARRRCCCWAPPRWPAWPWTSSFCSSTPSGCAAAGARARSIWTRTAAAPPGASSSPRWCAGERGGAGPGWGRGLA